MSMKKYKSCGTVYGLYGLHGFVYMLVVTWKMLVLALCFAIIQISSGVRAKPICSFLVKIAVFNVFVLTLTLKGLTCNDKRKISIQTCSSLYTAF